MFPAPRTQAIEQKGKRSRARRGRGRPRGSPTNAREERGHTSSPCRGRASRVTGHVAASPVASAVGDRRVGGRRSAHSPIATRQKKSRVKKQLLAIGGPKGPRWGPKMLKAGPNIRPEQPRTIPFFDLSQPLIRRPLWLSNWPPCRRHRLVTPDSIAATMGSNRPSQRLFYLVTTTYRSYILITIIDNRSAKTTVAMVHDQRAGRHRGLSSCVPWCAAAT